MNAKQIITSLLFFCFLPLVAVCQNGDCVTLGQNPSTAFPVCGTSKFFQAQVPLCDGPSLTVPNCDGGYSARNPFWYRFTCFKAGNLGFLIQPVDNGDDYDWQLYDITGHNADDVITNNSLIVTGNWAGTYGATGANAGGVSNIECGSIPDLNKPTFAAMPNLLLNHTYLLMISHFTPSQSGYSLSFSGGTASITDTTLPGLKDIRANCEGNQLVVRLKKKMKCSSLAQDGSDFTINAGDVSIISAEAPACSSGFDMDSIILTLNKALPVGTFTVQSKVGSDENTLLDNCDNSLDEGDSLHVSILPKQPTPLDSIAPVSCAPQVIELVFKKPIRCSSISSDGSDFSISGIEPVAIDAAYGNCGPDQTSGSVFLRLSHALTTAGTYTIAIKNGYDGNTIVDECGEVTPELQRVQFSVKDTVSATFNSLLAYGCKQDTIKLLHDGAHAVISWQWALSDNVRRNTPSCQVMYDSYGEKNISLVVSNGFCSDTASSVINLDNQLSANFLMADIACPNDPIVATDSSIGNIVSYNWNFGNGYSYLGKIPQPQFYPQSVLAKKYPVNLIVGNSLNCFDTLTKTVTIVYSCHIAVPTAFTPNGDGVNDYLYPLNAYKADHLVFTVYNRLGQKLFETKDWTNRWDGRFNGQLQGAGTYVWTLRYTDRDTQQFFSTQGTAVLIR